MSRLSRWREKRRAEVASSEFNRGYDYAVEQIHEGVSAKVLEREADDTFEVTDFDRGIAAAVRTYEAQKVEFNALTPQLQGEFEAALSKDHLDLSLEIRNTHVSGLMQHDLSAWARIADRTEMHREMLKAKCESLQLLCNQAEGVRDAAIADLDAVKSSRDTWRVLAALAALPWLVVAVVVLL